MKMRKWSVVVRVNIIILMREQVSVCLYECVCLSAHIFYVIYVCLLCVVCLHWYSISNLLLLIWSNINPYKHRYVYVYILWQVLLHLINALTKYRYSCAVSMLAKFQASTYRKILKCNSKMFNFKMKLFKAQSVPGRHSINETLILTIYIHMYICMHKMCPRISVITISI